MRALMPRGTRCSAPLRTPLLLQVESLETAREDAQNVAKDALAKTKKSTEDRQVGAARTP